MAAVEVLVMVGVRVGTGGGWVRYKGAQINPTKLMAVLHRSWGTLGSVGWFIVFGMSCGY